MKCRMAMCCISALTYKRNEKERHPQMDMRHGEVAIRSGCLFYGKPEERVLSIGGDRECLRRIPAVLLNNTVIVYR